MKKIFIVLGMLFLSTTNTFASELFAKVVQIEENYETIIEYSPIKIC